MKRTRAIVALAFLLALIGLAALALRNRDQAASAAQRELRTAQVAAADFYLTLRLTGYLDAVRVTPVVAEVGQAGRGGRGGAGIVSLLPDGTWLEVGDVIMRLDAAEVERTVTDLETQLAEAEERVRAAQADGETRVENARAGLTKAEEALALARTQNAADLERARAELAYQEKELEVAQGLLDRRRRLVEERLLPLADLERAEDDVRQRQLDLEKAQRALTGTQEDAAVVERLREMDIEKARVQLEQAEAGLAQSVADATRNLEAVRVRLEDARAQLEATQVRAPAPGLLLLERNWRGEPLRVGDEIGEGQRVANIVDPAEMWVRADISEADIERVALGQSATVLVPAVGATYPGAVEAIDNLARERMWWEGGVAGKKVFGALLRLDARDERLRPGMGATADLHIKHISQGLAVPLEALVEERGHTLVYRREGELFRPVPVRVLERSEVLAAVEGDLSEGDLVACELPPRPLIITAEVSP